MIANYHTHTFRCHHASGIERDYIERAIAGGIRILGFSDHAPMVFEGQYYSNFRMGFDQLNDYCRTLKELQDEYRNQIEIHIGLEAEYYPKHFRQFLDELRNYEIEYLILGQHYLNNEYDGCPSVAPHDDYELLRRYTDQVIEAIETGCFTYVAHPDVFNYTGSRSVYYAEMLRICQAAKNANIPLEINFLGLADHRNYPCTEYLDALAETRNDVVLGCDAHSPQSTVQPQTEQIARQLLLERGLTPLETVSLIDPFRKHVC